MVMMRILATAGLCVVAACSSTTQSARYDPTAFIGAPVSELSQAFGPPAQTEVREDGTSLSVFVVDTKVTAAPRTLNRTYTAPNNDGLERDRQRFAGNVGPGRRDTRRCTIVVVSGADQQVQSVETAPMGCSSINPV